MNETELKTFQDLRYNALMKFLKANPDVNVNIPNYDETNN